MQLLETLEFLHTKSCPPIAHCDIFLQNIFLHWPEQSLRESAQDKHHLPEIFLGDFGVAHSLEDPMAREFDLRRLSTVLIQTCLGSTQRREDLAVWKVRLPGCYSDELIQALSWLPPPTEGELDSWPRRPRILPTDVLRAKISMVALRKMAQLMTEEEMVDYRSTRPRYRTTIRLEETREAFLGKGIYEPFFYALVDRNSSTIIEVEKDPEAQMPTAQGKGGLPINLRSLD